MKQLVVNLVLSLLFLLGQFRFTEAVASWLLSHLFAAHTVLTYFERIVRRHFPGVKQISTAECAALLERERDKVLLLDVREEREFKHSHVPGARWMPLRTPPAALDAFVSGLTPGQAVIAMCSVGYRSSILAAKLQQLKAHPVYNLEGSVFRWAAEGRPLVDGEGRSVATVHPFNRMFGSMLPRRLWPATWTPVML